MAENSAPEIGPIGMGMPREFLAPPLALRKAGPKAQGLLPPIDIEITIDGAPSNSHIDSKTGALVTELDDGSVEIDYSPDLGQEDERPSRFDDNLADKINGDELNRIGSDLQMDVDTDNQSRQNWLNTRADGYRMLGLEPRQPQSSAADTSTAVSGQSTVTHPLLLESCIGFQANAQGELLPSGGPAKVEDKTDENGQEDVEAQALEDDFNYYLTTIATEYYPDTDRLLFDVGFGGCMIKKVYNCPIRRRPVAESIQIDDFIISNAATDMTNARCTHVIHMSQSTLKRMQLAGAYRNIDLAEPSGGEQNEVEQAKANIQGVNNTNQMPHDRDYIIYEVYCELNIKGYEHKKGGEITGLPLPYRVALEKDSGKVLAVHRNWDENDERLLPKRPFVKYSFIPAIGFYDLGLLNVVGNTNNALTAAWREILDSGMFANFPGFLYAKLGGRQNTNEMRVPPGGGVGIDTHGKPITDMVMPLPYKSADQGFVNFIEQVGETGARLGGTAQVTVADGRADAPVGTTLAMIEQTTKPMAAVHKRLHRAQAEELMLLKECFRADPDSFIKAVKRKGSKQWDVASFKEALENAAIVPQADPNTPSQLHRMLKAMGVKQLASGPNAAMYDQKAVDEYVLQQAGVGDPDRFFAKNPSNAAPPPDPKVIAQQLKNQGDEARSQADLKEQAIKLIMQKNESADQAAERQSREQIAAMGLKEAELDHNARHAETGAGLVNSAIEAGQTGDSNG